MTEVRTRFAPSPTGVLHLGSVRTALYCWLFARHANGKFILRIEDTDRVRSTEENVNAILDGLHWLGLEFDEGPYFQSKRYDRYSEIITDWVESGTAYRCYCSKEDLDALRAKQLAQRQPVRYDGRCRNAQAPAKNTDPVIRFKNPVEGVVEIKDLVRGTVRFQNSQLDDLVIARSDGTPTYNFTVVVDDYDMKISHVIRGDDHLNNAPRQQNMINALGADAPVYAHLPMILGPDGAKLSKRHGAVDIREYRDQGYLPAAVLNYLARLGWSYGDQEIFSTQELVTLFDLADINSSASTFNPGKLLWVNQQHIINLDPQKLGEQLLPYLEQKGFDIGTGPNPTDVAEAYKERGQTLSQIAEDARYCYEDFSAIDAKLIKKHLRPVILEPMRAVCERLIHLERWGKQEIGAAVTAIADETGLSFGKLGQPLRVAVTGSAVSPPIDVTLWLLGKEKTVTRIENAIRIIESREQNKVS